MSSCRLTSGRRRAGSLDAFEGRFDYDRSVRLHNAGRIGRFLAVLCVLFTPGRFVEASGPCVPEPLSRSAIGGIDHEPPQPRPQYRLTIASLNIAGQGRTAEPLASWKQQRSLDVLLLQEVGHTSMDGGAFIAELSERMSLHYAYAPTDRLENGYTQGLAILSRFPLDEVRVHRLKYHRLRFRSRCRIALAATVEIAGGRIRLVNVHLDTRINTSDRVAQLIPVLDEIGRAHV